MAKQRHILLSLVLLFAAFTGSDAGESDLSTALAQIRAIGSEGAGTEIATRAWQQVSEADATQITTILAAMKKDEPIAGNWLRAAVDTIAQRERKAGRELSEVALVEFLENTEMSPRARRTAYELLTKINPNAEQTFIPGMLDDPSLELRRDAVAMVLAAADELRDAGEKEQAIAEYGKAFRAARDVDQIKAAYEQLAEFENKASLARHFGFILRWHLVAPFDNTGTSGFDVAYPPEEAIDLNATYAGKNGQVNWKAHVTEDPYGIVDFNKSIDKHSGAIGYAYTEFVSTSERPVDIRLGCINGNKVWVNGNEVMANHVYHAGMEIDQYVGHVTLRKGKNQILVKVAQNEQTEDWAQRWQFQLRVCDEIGTAVLSADRPLPERTASRPNRFKAKTLSF